MPPDSGDPVALLDAGWRCEKAGALDKALEHYQRAAEETPDPAVVAESLRRQSSVYRMQSRWSDALDAARRSGAVAREANLPDLLADALNAEGAVYQVRGSFVAAMPIYEQALEASANPRTRGVVLQNLGAVAAQSGDLEGAEHRFRESVGCFRRAGYREGEAVALTNLVAVALDREEFELAEELAKQAVLVAREVDDLNLIAIATKNQAEALAGQKKFEQAESKTSEALGYFALTENIPRRVECLRFLGDLHVERRENAAAASCYTRGLELALQIDARAEVEKLTQRLGAISDRG